MKPALAIIVLCIAMIALPVRAQQNPADQPASKEDVQRMLDAMHLREQMQTVMNAVIKQQVTVMRDQMSKDTSITPEAQQKVEKFMTETINDFPMERFLDAVVTIYQKYYTKGDVDTIVAFYSTPTAQKMIAQTPAMTEEIGHVTVAIENEMFDKMKKRIQDQLAAENQQQKAQTTTKQ